MRMISGDLIALAKAGRFDVIVHGCNCFHTMGGGLAAQVRRHFPEAYEADLATPHGDRAKLGTCSFAVVERDGVRFTVVNAYTQFQPSTGGGVDVDYDAVRDAMGCLKWRHVGARIGLPQIGAGLAGGDWDRIEGIVRDVLGDEDVTIVTFSGAA